MPCRLGEGQWRDWACPSLLRLELGPSKSCLAGRKRGGARRAVLCTPWVLVMLGTLLGPWVEVQGLLSEPLLVRHPGLMFIAAALLVLAGLRSLCVTCLPGAQLPLVEQVLGGAPRCTEESPALGNLQRASARGYRALAAASCLPPPSCLSCAPRAVPRSAPGSCRQPLSGSLFLCGPISLGAGQAALELHSPQVGGGEGQAQEGSPFVFVGGSQASPSIASVKFLFL